MTNKEKNKLKEIVDKLEANIEVLFDEIGLTDSGIICKLSQLKKLYD
jgi:hypothetical protein